MKVKIQKTGETVEVYKSKVRNTFINSDNCTTEYEPLNKNWQQESIPEVKTIEK